MTGSASRDAKRFAEVHGPLDAVLQRVGRRTFELILIDSRGEWIPTVFDSEEVARAAAGELGATLHEGWSEDLAHRVGGRDAWASVDARRRAL